MNRYDNRQIRPQDIEGRFTRFQFIDTQPPEIEGDLEELDSGPVRLMPTFSGEQFSKTIQYGVIVETWYGKGLGGRQRREYIKQFSEQERKLLSRWYSKFYRWHLVTGTPKRVQLRLPTMGLLQRAVQFFAMS